MPYLPPIFYVLLSRYLSRNHLVTIPIPLCCHCIPIQYFPRTLLPVKCSELIRRVNILLLPRLVVECSVLSLLISPESYSGIVCLPVTGLVLGVNSPSIPASISYTFHFSPQKFANPQILLYLCTRILRWREICPAKSVSQRFFLGVGFDIFK